MAFWTSLALWSTLDRELRQEEEWDSDSWYDSDSDTEFDPEIEPEQESKSAVESTRSLTALPQHPDAVLTALPSCSNTPYEISPLPSYATTPQTSHRPSRSFDGKLNRPFSVSTYDDTFKPLPAVPPPQPELTLGQRFITVLTSIYGNEPAGPPVTALPSEPAAGYPQGWRLILLLLSGALPYVVAVIDDTIIATIIPVLVTEFQKPGEVGWYASAYFLPLTVFMPLVGKAYSLWKIKWIFFGSLVVLLVGSIVCARAETSITFIMGRVISGSGAAGIINGAMRIIGVSSSRQSRTYLEATGALFMGVCTVTGPMIGGVISTHVGWRWAFWINVPLAAFSLIVIAIIMPSEANQAALGKLSPLQKIARLDPIGSSALVACLICLITLLEHISTSLGFATRDKTLAVLAALFFVIFVVHEYFIRPDLGLIPRDLIKHRAVWACCGSLFLLFAGWINFIFFLSMFFQTVLGDSAQTSAINLLPYVIAVSIAAAITGVSVSWIKYYNPIFILGGVCFSLGAGLTMTFDDKTTAGARIGYMALMGLGVGFLLLANVTPCQTFLEEKDHSVANGLTFFSSLLGATISLPISNTLFNRTLLSKVINLDVPDLVKLSVLLDPTTVRARTPPELLPLVLNALVQSIRKTFLLGLCFAIACTIGFFFVPWKPLLAVVESEVRRRSTATMGRSRRNTMMTADGRSRRNTRRMTGIDCHSRRNTMMTGAEGRSRRNTRMMAGVDCRSRRTTMLEAPPNHRQHRNTITFESSSRGPPRTNREKKEFTGV